MSLYVSTYDAIWRLQARLTGSNSVNFYNSITESQYFSKDRLQELQWAKLKSLLKYAYENVPYYKNLFKRISVEPDDIRTYSDFLKLPPITREDLQNHRKEFISESISPNQLIADATGGSTGKPVQFHVDASYRSWVSAIMRVQDNWAGLQRGEPHAYLWGSKIDLAQQRESSKVILSNIFKRNLFLDCFQMDEESLMEYLHKLEKFRPKLLTGYGQALVVLAKYIQHQGVTRPSIGAIQTGAEPIGLEQRTIISDILQAPVFERYGGRDIGAIAHECDAHEGMHIFSLNYMVECIRHGKPAQEGELGELIVTQLDNLGAPFIRYRSEDMGVISSRVCSCGRNLPILEKVVGRVLDLIVGMNGRILSGVFFPHLFKDFDVGEFQVIQKQRDLIQVNISEGKSFSSTDKQNIENILKHYLGDNMRVQIEMVKSILKTPSGKFRVTISEVPVDWLN